MEHISNFNICSRTHYRYNKTPNTRSSNVRVDGIFDEFSNFYSGFNNDIKRKSDNRRFRYNTQSQWSTWT